MIKLHAKLFGGCRVVRDRSFIRTAYFLSFGRLPDLEQPQTFNEHICAIKCDEKTLRLAPYADKATVREYVKQTIGAQYLIDEIGVYKTPEEIPYESLPERFVIKCTHASGYNILVTGKSKLDTQAVNRRLKRWLSSNYYTAGRENNYKRISPRILIEQYLETQDALLEHKIFCFQGKPQFIDVNCFKGKRRTAALYDTQWNLLPVRMGYPADQFDRPKQLSELLEAAEKLAAPFVFVRVDLYCIDDGILFSELTFTPGGGLVHFDPPEYDRRFGELFEGEG